MSVRNKEEELELVLTGTGSSVSSRGPGDKRGCGLQAGGAAASRFLSAADGPGRQSYHVASVQTRSV